MKKTFTKIIVTSLLIAPVIFLDLPLFVHASTQYPGLVQCDGVVDATSTTQVKCNFAQLVHQIQYLINWMFMIAVPIAILLFAWSGILFMQPDPGKRKQAKEIFTTVGIGFALMLVAWFVIYTILNLLADPSQGFSALLKN